jgi:sulfatase maturation enzyme AslB (radical SAM superfamily)
MLSIEKTDWYADYIVQWRPTDMCNYDCSYCTPSNHLPIVKKKLPIIKDLIFATDNIKHSVDPTKKVLVYITGGEPFLINDIHLWFEHMAKCNFNVGVFTNGSMPIKTYMKCKDSFSHVSIKISFHPETSNIDHIVELANTIVEHNGKVEIRAMLANKLFDRVDELEQKLNGIAVTRLPVFPLYNPKTKTVNPTHSSSKDLVHYKQKIDSGDLGYFTKEELDRIKDSNQSQPEYLKVNVDGVETNASTIVRNNQNKFKGWKCGITNKKILIQANGNVQYGVCENGGHIGNIFDPIELFTQEYSICHQDECHTIDEVMITKFKV